MRKGFIYKMAHADELATKTIDAICDERNIVLHDRESFINKYKAYLIAAWSVHMLGEVSIATTGLIGIAAIMKGKFSKGAKILGTIGSIYIIDSASAYNTNHINERYLSVDADYKFFKDNKDDWHYRDEDHTIDKDINVNEDFDVQSARDQYEELTKIKPDIDDETDAMD